ncbi:MAG: peptide chain release factor N(5)-glutamine methyltransferase [Spirochaetota bacterium]
MKAGNVLQETIDFLKSSLTQSPVLDAELIVEEVTGIPGHEIRINPDEDVSRQQYEKICDYRQRRKECEPMAYILGRKEFYSINFRVNNDVLIPRPETELLVDLAIYYTSPHGRLVDIGTGSGAIAIAVKCNRPDIQVYASDISERALSVAENNAETILGPERQIELHKGYLFEPFRDLRFDMIVSNPPYVDPALKEYLQRDLEYEPPEALYSAEGGREIATRLIEDAREMLNDDGMLLIEISESMSEYIIEKSTENGFTVSIFQDYSGLPRIAVLKNK